MASRRASDTQFDHFVGAVRDYAILTLDAAGHVRTWNLGAQRIKGYASEEVVGAHFSIFYTDEDVAAGKPQDTLDRAMEHGSFEDEGWRVRKDGSRFWANVVVTALIEDGELAGFTKVTRDVTERKAFEDELIRARKDAEEANRAKDDFLSSMSHELRTPLNSVLGFAQLLERDKLTAKQQEAVHQIHKSGRHLLDLINEVLDIARVASGRLTLSPEPVGVSKLVAEVVVLVRPMADERSIQIETENGSGLHVEADRQRLKQVLLNLLSNAVKFNRHAGAVRVTWDKAPGNRLRLHVHDDGPGIPPELHHRVFVPFDRLGVNDAEIEGTGLGLALSKDLTEKMGGTLSMTSTPGDGTTFTVELPIVEPQLERFERERERKIHLAGTSLRIVYIEDNVSNLRLVQRILEERPDMELLPAMQGGLGVDLVRLHRPDVVLLDLHLPDMGGEQVLEALQADATTADIPVVVMSADARPTRIERLMRNGATDYLAKPIDIDQFLALLDRLSVEAP